MPDYKVSVDPGKNGCGVAVWMGVSKFSLKWAGYIKQPAPGKAPRADLWGSMAQGVKEAIFSLFAFPEYISFGLILEIPQIYSGVSEKDPNDLIDLAGVQGAIVGATGAHVDWSPLPREWKGQLPKEVSEKRVESKLNDAEKAWIEWPTKSLRHNVYDALHLGLVYLEKHGLR